MIGSLLKIRKFENIHKKVKNNLSKIIFALRVSCLNFFMNIISNNISWDYSN